MRKLFTILSAVAITLGVGVPAGAATKSSGKHPDRGHPAPAKAHHGDKDRDRKVSHGDKDRDRKVSHGDKDRDRDRHASAHDRDRDRHVNDGDHDRDDRHVNDRDRGRDRRDFDRRYHHHHHYYYYHYYYHDHRYPYYRYYDDDYYDYYYDRYYYGGYYGGYYNRPYYNGGYNNGGYNNGGYNNGGNGNCDESPPPGVVAIRCTAFDPPQLHINVGQQVVWSWQDGNTAHTVTADDGTFDSGSRTAGELRITFSHPTNFTYHCRIHPQMTGSVVVS